MFRCSEMGRVKVVFDGIVFLSGDKFTSLSLQQRINDLAYAQRKSQAACCRGFSRGVNKPTTRQTSHTNDFVNAEISDRGGEGAGRAIALPLFCWGLFSRVSVDMEKIPEKLLGFALKGGRLEPVVFDEFLRTMQFLWKSGCLLVRTITTRCACKDNGM